MLISSQIADRSQSYSFSLGHRGRGVRGNLLGGQAVQQNAGFLLGADRGDLQDRSAVTGLDQALVVAHSRALGGLGMWQRRKVKLVGLVQDAALVDGTIEQAIAGLVPAREGRSNFFQEVASAELLLYSHHSLCQIGIVPAFGGIRQRGPIAVTDWNNRNPGIGKVGACKLLVKEPDQLVGGRFLFKHGGQTSGRGGSLTSCKGSLRGAQFILMAQFVYGHFQRAMQSTWINSAFCEGIQSPIRIGSKVTVLDVDCLQRLATWAFSHLREGFALQLLFRKYHFHRLAPASFPENSRCGGSFPVAKVQQ